MPSFWGLVLRQALLLWTAPPTLSPLLFSSLPMLSPSHLICLGDIL